MDLITRDFDTMKVLFSSLDPVLEGGGTWLPIIVPYSVENDI